MRLPPGAAGSGASVMPTDTSAVTKDAASIFNGAKTSAWVVLPANVPNKVINNENARTETAKTAPRADGLKNQLRLV